MRTVKALHPALSRQEFSLDGMPTSYVRSRARGILPAALNQETRIPVNGIEDIVKARRIGRMLVREMGLSSSQMTLVTTAISELSRNILLYACKGEIVLSRRNHLDELCLSVTAIDQGPGIENLAVVMAGGYSTSGGLGLGLSGLRRIVDTFEVTTQPGAGTQVRVGIRA